MAELTISADEIRSAIQNYVSDYTPDVSREEVGIVTEAGDRKSTRLNSSHANISYAVFCLKKKKKQSISPSRTTPHTPQCYPHIRRTSPVYPHPDPASSLHAVRSQITSISIDTKHIHHTPT